MAMPRLWLFQRKKKRKVDRSQGTLVSVTVKVTPEQKKYLDQMWNDHNIPRSQYMRNLLAKDMLGYKTAAELFAKFRIPIGHSYEETVETTITTRKEERKVAIRPAQQSSLPTHADLMTALKKKFKEKGLTN